jgi:transcriptional regulator with XRE-family HTH domain
MVLGKELKRKRVEIMNQTLKDVSEKSGFKSAYLSEIERGVKIPRNGCSLKKLSEGYNIHFDMVLSWLIQDIKKEAGIETA